MKFLRSGILAMLFAFALFAFGGNANAASFDSGTMISSVGHHGGGHGGHGGWGGRGGW